MTLVLCYIINFIPGLKFRVDEDAEIVGLDEAECGEVSLPSFALAIYRDCLCSSGAWRACLSPALRQGIDGTLFLRPSGGWREVGSGSARPAAGRALPG